MHEQHVVRTRGWFDAQVVELEQHLARLRSASMATAERAAEVHQQRDHAIASMEARVEAAERQAAEADVRCKDLEARLQVTLSGLKLLFAGMSVRASQMLGHVAGNMEQTVGRSCSDREFHIW